MILQWRRNLPLEGITLQWQGNPDVEGLKLQWRGPNLVSTEWLRSNIGTTTITSIDQIMGKIAIISGPAGPKGDRGERGEPGAPGEIGGIPEILDGGNF